MKVKRKLLPIILALMLALALFSGCGNSEQVQQTDEDDVVSTEETETKEEATEEPVEEMAEITVMILSLGPQGDGAIAVQDKLNEITEAQINTHVNLQYVEPGQYAQQLNLAIAGDEDVDLVMLTPIPAVGFSALITSNALVPLDDLMAEYGQETLDLLGDYVNGMTIDGTLYGLPNSRDFAMGAYIMMRKDLLEESGLLDKAESMTTWTEYEEIMTEINGSYDMYGIGNSDAEGTIIEVQGVWLGDESFANATAFDYLGDSLKVIASDEDGNVISYYETEEYQQMIARVRDWYDKGLVYKDAATSDDLGDTLVKNNLIFSQTVIGELASTASHSSAAGYELFSVKLAGIPTGTGAIRKFGWAVPTCAKDQEAAVKFMNLMYTSAEVNNLLAWGIEGVDYVVEDGIAKYPDGVTADTVAYHTADFLYGNQFLTLPWEGNAADLRETVKAEMEANGVSPYLGFSCDTSSISNEITAITNVTAEYVPGLNAGALDEDDYNDFIEKLKAAGIDKVVAEYQRQLDEWMANN